METETVDEERDSQSLSITWGKCSLERVRQVDGRTDRQTGRQGDRETGRQGDRETERQRQRACTIPPCLASFSVSDGHA
jgi:hypothetical protein